MESQFLSDIVIYFSNALFELLSFTNSIGEFIYPLLALGILWYVYTRYTRAKFISDEKQERVLLELRLPKEQVKSPLAMELALSALHQTGRESNWYDRWVLGKHRPWFSLEIISIEGNVHFLIWTERNYQPSVESAFYSQFPGLEIIEVPDYVNNVPFGQPDSEWGLFGAEFVLSKEDALPIKTYVDYGLDKDPKEELKVDPLTPIVEFFGSLQKNEQAWLQILVRATKKSNRLPGGLFGKKQDWRKEGEEYAKEKKEEFGGAGDPEEGAPKGMTTGEKMIIAAIERNISKEGFDCGVRAMYLAKGDAFRGPNIPALMGSFKQFNSNELNGFKPKHVTNTDYPWQEYTAPSFLLKGVQKSAFEKAKLFNAYVRRGWFHPPVTRQWFVLSSEELATLFHLPGQVSETPTLSRIESKKSEAPSNLPI